MAAGDDDLNQRLSKSFERRSQKRQQDSLPATSKTKTAKSDAIRVVSREEAEPVSDAAVVEEKMGVISRLKLRNAESAHELQKAKMTYETETELIRHKADASIRESKAFWDAKSVEVAESIKTYVQATVRALEIDRLDSRNVDLQKTYESAATALEKARQSPLPDVMKDRLIEDILNNFERTLERIQNDTIVSKYDLD
ncbi:MAG: hypothetical protein ABJZ55_18555 [Fuerstiella sp.]